MAFNFGRKKRETSPGGSVVLRYECDGQREAAVQQEFRADDASMREAVYDRFFGTCETVYHEVLPKVPHIDVYVYPAGQKGRNFCTLVTGGMSDLPMHFPAEAAGKVPRRVELIFYCAEPKPVYLEGLRWLAAFPHSYRTWVGSGHTVPNGDPPEPMWGSNVLNTALLMPTIVKPDNTLQNELCIEGDAVEFLWVVPLSQGECDLKLAKGFNAILDLFQHHRHPHIFNADRRSYV